MDTTLCENCLDCTYWAQLTLKLANTVTLTEREYFPEHDSVKEHLEAYDADKVLS